MFRATAAVGWALFSRITDRTTFVNGLLGIRPPLRRPCREDIIHSLDSNSERRISFGSVQTVVKGRGAALVRKAKLSSLSASKYSKGASFVENISVEIRYCPGCRWMTKAFWMATELLQNSDSVPEEFLQVTVIPSEPGTFDIAAIVGCSGAIDTTKDVQLWDRKVDGGFPPIDLIEFQKRLEKCLDENKKGHATIVDGDFDSPLAKETASSSFAFSHVVIKYCPSSGYLLRAAYYGQELLTTFCEGELGAISLKPIQKKASTCSFSVELLNDSCLQAKSPQSIMLWENSKFGRFPEVKELKRLVRDKVTPQKDLGHSEEQTNNNNINGREGSLETATIKDMEKEVVLDHVNNASANDFENANANGDDREEENNSYGVTLMDDDKAEEARRFFGVL